jgi:FkbM family methyltransferase
MKAVYVKSGLELAFSENTFNPYLSIIFKFISYDAHHLNRLYNQKNYLVKTISLIDLLKKYNALKVIDYLSIDTEGSEFAILNNFDFSKYKIKIITCEHNFSSNRNKILKLLTKNGSRRIHKNISNFDDWFVNNSFL